MSSPDPAGATEKWQRLTESCALPIAIADGVELRLSAGTHDLVHSLTLAVHDLADARRFLAGRGLLNEHETDEVVLSRLATGGLTFRLVEAVAEDES